MKKLLLILSLFSFVLFSACQKGDLKKDDKDYKKDDYDKDDYDKEICFELVYPVTYEMPDGSNLVINDEETMESEMKDWYENHPDVDAKPQLIYPVDVIFITDKEDEEDKIVTIENEEKMIALKKDCYDEKDLCFELVFPITYIMPDGSNISADNEDNLWVAVKDWYENHPDVAEKPSLQYPVEIAYPEDDEEGGEVVLISNEEEMIDAKKDCYEGKDKEHCFDLVYPVTYTLPDGSTVSGDKETVWTAIKEWYENHPDVVAKPELNYPVDIQFTADDDVPGEVITVNTEEEMIDIKKDCYEDKEPCFEIVFPYTVTMPDGSNITADNEENLWEAVKDWYEAHPDVEEDKPEFVYPIEIAFEDGDAATVINNEDELILAIEDCYTDEDDGE